MDVGDLSILPVRLPSSIRLAASTGLKPDVAYVKLGGRS